MRIQRRLEIRIALGAETATALVRHGGAVHRAVVPWTLPPEQEDATASIVQAFRAIDAQLGADLGYKVRAVDVYVALLPPLSDARIVPLPPMRLAEAETVIRRDVARHFVGSTAPRSVGVQPAENAFLAAAAPIALVEAIRGALQAMGWTPVRIVPAHGAWLHAARPEKSGDHSAAVAVLGDAAHVLVQAGTLPASVRRVPAAWTGEVIEAAGETRGSVAVYADGGNADGLATAFAAAGWSRSGDSGESAAVAAAAHAHRSKLEFVAPSQYVERARKNRLRAVRIGLAASVLLVLAGLTELWGSRRELELLRARRAAIRADVAPLLAVRDSIGRLREQAATLGELESKSPQWTRALFDLALLLPEDTHLTSLRATADTLFIEAAGDRAGEAMQALRRAGSLADVRMLGAVQRELEDGETSVERFRLRAVLNRLPAATDVTRDSKPNRSTVTQAAAELAGRPR